MTVELVQFMSQLLNLVMLCSYQYLHVKFAENMELPAPTEKAASLRVPRKLCRFFCFFYVLFLTLVPQVILGFITYSREELLNIRATSTHHQYDQEYDFPEADPVDRKSTRLNSSHSRRSRMPSSA